jgi:GNAT superfamily N-acetyltransferase
MKDAFVGYALFFHNYSSFVGKRGLYLEDVYVQPSQRGSGLGTALLQRLAALAVERQCGRFEWTVLDWNQQAISFYEKMGASVMPDWRVVRLAGEALERLAAASA